MRPRRFRITVSAQNIAAGKPGDSGLCPVALACLDRGFARPFISPRRWHFVRPGYRGYTSGQLSPRARDFVRAFDDHLVEVAPQTFVFTADWL